MTVSDLTLRLLSEAGLDPVVVEDLIRMAIAEDVGPGEDVTSGATIPADHRSTADVVARQWGVLAGLPVAALVFEVVAPSGPTIHHEKADGDSVGPGDVLLSATGSTREMLLAERTALNLLCHLSGVATLTRAWVTAIAGTGAQVRDTRKTTPLLRSLQKYAVRCGGGVNHRAGLYDAALVKDNHVLAAGGPAQAYRRVRRYAPDVPVQVEVDSLADAIVAVDAGAGSILLDNFTVAELEEAVGRLRGRAVLEASGGLTLDVAREVAQTGVDYLAVGALTHSVPALDIGLDLRADS